MTLPEDPFVWSSEAQYCLLERLAIMQDSGVPDALAAAEKCTRAMAEAGLIEEEA